jgi:formate C-acetyltransferase
LAAKRKGQTLSKFERDGYMDVDDTGVGILPYEIDWGFVTHADGLIHGSRLAGLNFRRLAEMHPVYVDPANAIAGKVYGKLRLDWNPEYAYDALKPTHERYAIRSGIEARHKISPDPTIAMQLGWKGLLDKVRRYASIHGSDEDKREFYEGAENVILGMQAWIGHTIDDIRRQLAEEKHPEYRENLQEMLEVHEWIVDYPPRTFREACQHLAWIGILIRSYTGSGAGCQLDEVLYPYYQRDRELERIDDADALFYVACMLINDARHNAICGLDADGNDVTNRLSYIVLEAVHRIGVAANLNIGYHARMDPTFFKESVQYVLADRNGAIRYSNVDALVKGFMRSGYPIELARQRKASVCNWTNIHGREFTMNDQIKVNLAKVFEVAYLEMMEAETIPRSVDVLWELFARHLREVILCVARGIDFKHEHYGHCMPELALDLMCYGPIEQGLDAVSGGLEFYHFCIAGTALATVADSFAALEQRIVREGVLGWDELYRHIQHDFQDADGERVRWMLHSSERYGQDTDSLGDRWAVKVSRLYTKVVQERPTPAGHKLLPQFYSWADAIAIGREVGATPNGRRAGAPISTGPNPHDGFRADGAATALANAVLSVQTGYGNIDILYLDLDPGIADALTVDKVAALIRAHFEQGGTAVFINVIDAETLREAHKDPEAYPDLIVRVAGFTAHFAVLSPEMRQMVVDRVLPRSR